MEIIDSNEIIIKTPVDVKVEIFKAYEYYPPKKKFVVEGNGMEQNFQVNLEK